MLRLNDEILATIPNGRITFEEGIKSFITYCQAKNLRPRTIQNYQQGIDRFLSYYQDTYPSAKSCGNIEKKDVEFYTIHLKGSEGMTVTSANTYLRNLRAWLYYLMNEENAVMSFKVRMMRVDRKMKETYTDTELRILTNRPSMRGISFADYRNWVIVNFLLATGVRASTLINVRVIDLDFANGFITLDYTKSGKDYRIPMDNELKLILLEYLEITDGQDIEPLFISEDRKPISYEGLKSAMQRYNKSRGINKTGIHLYRHTFAKMCVMNGMDVFTLQKMLGHADLTTSRNYVEMYSEDLKIRFEDFSPLGNLRRTPPKSEPRRRGVRVNMNRLK